MGGDERENHGNGSDDHADRRLIEQFALGTRAERGAAFEVLRTRFRPVLLATARRTLFHRADAELCVEEFLQHLVLHNRLRSYLRYDPREVALEAYLRTAIRRFARREFQRLLHGRSRKRRRPMPPCPVGPGAREPEARARAQELGATLRAWFERLRPA